MKRDDTAGRTADQRWLTIQNRDQTGDARFVYAVRTTGVYCRPHCSSRRPKRRNVEFFETASEAEAAGYRPCRRCRPNQTADANPTRERLVQACRFIERSSGTPPLATIAAHVGLSPHHLLRQFRAHLGLTPKQYAVARRVDRLKQALERGDAITEAIYNAGYESSGRCYAEAGDVLGMTPKQYRDSGRHARIRFAAVGCSLGRLLVATTEKGVCRIALGDKDSELLAELRRTFPGCERVTKDSAFARLLKSVIALVETPGGPCAFPLDIRGTAFQCKVWCALQAIPPGETRSYTALAAAVGQPKAVRAVASACAANHLAVAVPCHRVVRSDGNISGYRWGPARKRALLEREAAATKKRGQETRLTMGVRR